jgi:hypothetical protein
VHVVVIVVGVRARGRALSRVTYLVPCRARGGDGDPALAGALACVQMTLRDALAGRVQCVGA